MGIQILEQCCRKVVSISDDVDLVEARKFDQELNIFCTVPKSTYQLELIEQGAKYELVFENKGIHKKQMSQNNHLDIHQILGSSSINLNDDYNDYGISKAIPSSNDSTTTFEPSSSNYSTENALLSTLFARRNNQDTLPDSDLNSSESTSNAWSNRDNESVKLLPDVSVHHFIFIQPV
jgi:hypothetical protein